MTEATLITPPAAAVTFPRLPRGRARALGRWSLSAAAAILLLVVLFPFLWMVQMALRPADQMFSGALLVAPTLENFAALWHGNFAKSFVNSVLVSTLSTGVSLLLGVPAAYVLTRWRFRARRAVSFWVLASRMAPPIAFTIPFFLAYRWVGLQDSVTGLALIYMTFTNSIVVWFMKSFFAAIPRSIEEAAWIDGCGVLQAFFRVTLPLAAPGLAATAVFCFIFSWNDFFFALILTRTNAITAPVAITNFLQYEGWEWGKIAASGTLVMLPVLVFTLLVRTYLVRGLTAGGVKE